MKYTKLLAASAGLLLVGSQIATAVPSLRLTSGGDTVILTDNNLANALGWNSPLGTVSGGAPPAGTTLATDTSPAIAGFTQVTTVVGNFNITSTTGSTFPTIGSLTSPQMDILNISISSGAGGILTIEFSQDGFGPTSGTGGRLAIGGTLGAGASVDYSAYADGGNGLFVQTDHFNTLNFGPGSGGFSGDASGAAPGVSSPQYSLTQVVTVSHPAGAGIFTSLNASLHVPDGGTTVSLLGLTLLGLGAGRRALRK